MATAQRADGSQTVTIDGHRLKLTHLDKVIYPETGTTKADVLDYLARIADVMIPHMANRPATRKRWVNGVGTAEKPGQLFFQKNLDESTPKWVKRRDIQHKDHVNSYPLVNDLATLTWLGQISALEIHVPQWQFGRTGVQKNPDRLVLDLDPGDGVGLQECAEVARLARSILQGMGLDPLPVTSGSKGIHLYAALDGKQTSDDVSAVAHELARALEADHPDLVVSDMKKSLRTGRVLVDWSQNSASKTTVAPYSLRGRLHPMVAAPRTWRELASADLRQLDYTEVLARVKRRGDPLAGLTAGHLQSLEPTSERMDGFDATEETERRLAIYRSKRDASKTKEPMGETAAKGTKRAKSGNSPAFSADPTFVIQEHHASRLHWDFRLEHEGVLVSWALPTGVPTDTKSNHLAVQTEDHPLEYGAFEGSIPEGEYGAGDVTIWDAGSYELEKWRDDEEIIATLHGEKHGTNRYALIHTGGDGRAANNWLIHLMKAQPAENGTDAETTGKKTPAKKTKPHAKGSWRSPAAMLATLGGPGDLIRIREADAEEWAFEMKWDGIRAIAVVEGNVARLISRNGNDLTVSYPELAVLTSAVDADAIIDGEIVALNRRGRPDFGLLQTRMKLTRKADVEKAMTSAPVQFMAFDVLQVAGESVMKNDYDHRREILENLVREKGPIAVPPAFPGDLDTAMASSLELGLEGVMAKRRDGRYQPGRRSSGWVKLKHHRSQEVIVVGWLPGAGSRSGRIGSLLLGVPDGESLRYVGRVGTGFSEKQLDETLVRLRRIERKTPALNDVPASDARDAHWVTPSLVGEVEFAEWTPTRRLRQPSWRGWRPDKDPVDVEAEG
ncbi:ATP-dependent DNA ligase LigD ligase module /ATP-dependent DNA ligase LigD phosphoesterase module /ATP-dependent DNA ligase LigD polymerase module [Homoserinimonas aerilata]|uniref:DNA ligase (ATP) n=1 Tax=Homoserinimonas aerilata TaxID=1162970 RepID=A0A542YHU5_9MICO|nr:ATP-dependent DNA ligase [Homoserinimonas aerilata]TQL47687.1 ATP-dependent DNA ligase LigD ligase module /ATP-dependent DNA ligase LigD phosphoesterase module /ATP-dependent DNA ligase LigD polymerase module [Homoserinimonas aerilata]